MMSVTVLGSISIRPAMANQMRSNQFIGATQKPIMAAPMPNMPPHAVTRFTLRRYGVVPIRTMAGFRTKMYGTMKAPMASFEAVMPVQKGLDLAMPAPA